jgi:hypothetical protein
MTETKSAWSEVGDRFDELGLKLKLHYQEAAGEVADDGELRKAVDEMRAALDHACEAIGNAVKDPAVKEDAKDVAGALRRAVATTFADASDGLREHFGRRGKA